MLVYASRLLGTPIISLSDSEQIGYISNFIIEPKSLKAIGFIISGAGVSRENNILDARSIREYSSLGCVVNSADEFVGRDDVIKIRDVLKLNFALPGLKVETKKGSKLGTILDFTMTNDDFTVEQLIVKRPLVKSFLDPELTIPRTEIVEVTDYKIIVKDEEKTIRSRAYKEDFIPNFVNPFRTPAHAKDV